MVFLEISSADRNSGTDSNFEFLSTQTLTAPTGVRLCQTLYANVFDNVNSTLGNQFFISLANDSSGTGATTYSITIANNGFYNMSQLLSTIKAALDDEISPLVSTLTYDDVSGKVSIAVATKYIKVLGNPDSTGVAGPTLNLILGFSQTQDSTVWSQTQTAVFKATVQRVKKLRLQINLINSSSYTTNLDQYDRILASLPVAQIPYSQYYLYQPIDTTFLPIASQNLNVIQVQIYDDYNNLIDFYGQPITLLLEVI